METKESLELAETELPPELRSVLQVLVKDYRAAASAHIGQGRVNYGILADLVAHGWRKVA